jgi:hypothetical protein
MRTTEQDFDSGIVEKQREDQVAKNAPERPASLYGRQGRVKPDPEPNALALLDWKDWATLGDEPWFWSE